MAWGYGLKTAKMGIENTGVVEDMPTSTGKKNMYVTNIDNGEYIRLRGVDFGEKEARQFIISAANKGICDVTLRLDSPFEDGKKIGSVTIKGNGTLDKYNSFKTKVNGAVGLHDLYICFDRVEGDCRLDWWQFK